MLIGIRLLISKIKRKFVVEKIESVIIKVPQEKLLLGKTALITGGGSGIGFAIARGIVDCGGRVILAGRSNNKLNEACNKLGRGNAEYTIIDVCDTEDIKDKVGKLTKSLGSNRSIDILINSAGIHGTRRFGEITNEDYDSIMDTNLKGLFFMSQEISKYMIREKIKGNILNISSASALKPAVSPYEISKWGVRGVTVGLAKELIPFGIVVNALAPGPTATDLLGFEEGQPLNWEGNPSGRVATPEEIATLAVHMVSNAGRYIVGDSFYITGGSGTVCIDK